MENPKTLTPEIKAYIDQLVKEGMTRKVPHICSYCNHFTFNDPPKKGVPNNRYCQYKGDIVVIKGICQMWVAAEDMELRVRGNYTV